MQVRLNFPPGTEANPVFADDGTTLIGVDITPFFPGRRSSAVIGHGEATNRHAEKLDQFILSVSGVKGTLFFRRRTEGIVPFVDLTEAERQRLSRDEPDDEEEEDADDEGTSSAKRSG